MRGWKNTLHAGGEQNKSEEAVPVSDKIDFKTKTTEKDKDIIKRH